MRMPWIGAVVMLAVMLTPTAALRIQKPDYKGVPINFCPSVSGLPEDCDPIRAATLHCQRINFDRAKGYEGPVPADATVALQLMMDGKPRPVWNTTGGTMERCEAKDGKTCSTFSSIDCIREKMFVRPMVDGKPLGWCTVGPKAECCREAADAFCARNSFVHGAWAFNGPIPSVDASGAKQDTVSLDEDNVSGTGQACDSRQGECQTFVSINCQFKYSW